jgi:hypothetical protein
MRRPTAVVAIPASLALGHDAAPDTLELGIAHATAERSRPEAVGHAVYRQCARLRGVRVIVLRHFGFADQSTGRAIQVDLPTVSRPHAVSIAHRWGRYAMTNDKSSADEKLTDSVKDDRSSANWAGQRGPGGIRGNITHVVLTICQSMPDFTVHIHPGPCPPMARKLASRSQGRACAGKVCTLAVRVEQTEANLPCAVRRRPGYGVLTTVVVLVLPGAT